MKILSILFLGSVLILNSCGKSSSKAGGPDTVPPIATPGAPEAAPPTAAMPATAEKHAPGKFGDTVVSTTGLMHIDKKPGKGDASKMGSTVSVNYTGMLTDGTVFDSNTDPKLGHTQPFDVTIGKSSVIQGWTEGLQGMKAGGTRRLIIPSDLGYGPGGNPPKIPGGATLVFDVEILSVK
jgi:FKBP-type peptidyl-prolyl cis-trans isomerase